MSELSDKAVSYWPMHEVGNATRVDEVAAHNLTASALMDDRATFCATLAAEFPTGSNNNLVTAAAGGLLPSSEMEVTAWFEWDVGSSSTGFIIGCQSAGVFDPQDYAIVATAGGGATFDVDFKVRNTANTAYGTATVAGLAKGTNYFINAYYDGVNVGLSCTAQGGASRNAFTTTAFAGGIRQAGASVFMGSSPFIGSFRLIGYMKDMGFWEAPLTEPQRDYLYGLSSGGCPPEWPFDDSPGSGIAFEAYPARILSGAQYSTAAYGSKTYLLIANPVAGVEYRVTEPLYDLDGAQPGDKIALKIRRDGDDPNDPSTASCALELVALDYYTKGV